MRGRICVLSLHLTSDTPQISKWAIRFWCKRNLGVPSRLGWLNYLHSQHFINLWFFQILWFWTCSVLGSVSGILVLESIWSEVWLYRFVLSHSPILFQILSSFFEILRGIPYISRRSDYFSANCGFFYFYLPWPLPDVAKFASIGLMIHYSRMCLIMFWMSRPACRIRLSFLPPLVKPAITIVFGSVTGHFENSSLLSKMVHLVALLIFHGQVAPSLWARLSLSILWLCVHWKK